nr:DUF1080 domain-containing protein [Saprospiraceae bacterium]
EVEPTKPEATEFWTPVPNVVKPGNTYGQAPADAIVLFDGKNFGEWEHLDGSAVKWTLSDGAATVQPKAGDIRTKRSFGSCQLHIEWRTPSVVKGTSQGRGNSGIFFQERYELQVLDNYDNPTYTNGQASSIYKQTRPLVNACKGPGEWQTYDAIYTAPVFDAQGKKIKSGMITVLHNGVLTQLNTEIQGTTEYIGWPKNVAHGEAPFKLQDHGDLVSYRNIWVRRL